MHFAQGCSFKGLRVLLLESERALGGCHRVRRVRGEFTEHGPRHYFSAFDQALKQAGLGAGMRAHFEAYRGHDRYAGVEFPSARDMLAIGSDFTKYLLTGSCPDSSVGEWLTRMRTSTCVHRHYFHY